MFRIVAVIGLKGQLAVALFAGILLGLVINYGYFMLIKPPSAWHTVSSFILASDNSEDLAIVQSYPNVYNKTGPQFTVKADFWRIKWETVQYYKNLSSWWANLDLYYVAPSKFWIWNATQAYDVGGIVGFIELLDPMNYTWSVFYRTDQSGDLTTYYRSSIIGGAYEPVMGYWTLMTGKGEYYVSALETTGCFRITIEEYY